MSKSAQNLLVATVLSEVAAAIEHSDDIPKMVKRLRARRDQLMQEVADAHRETLTPEQREAFDRGDGE